MTLRTPRRRISPRTKQKYRAIKNFLRRALGTSSQGDVVTSSSIEVSVSDLKDKIEGLEYQLSRVSEHCKDLATLKETLKKESVNLATPEKLELENVQKLGKSSRNLRNVETKLLYQHSNREYNNRNKGDVINISHEDKNGMTFYEPTSSKNLPVIEFKTKSRKSKKSNEINERYESHNHYKSKYTPPAHSTSSFHSLFEHTNRDCINPNSSGQQHKQYKKKEYNDTRIPKEYRDGDMVRTDLPYKAGRHKIQNKSPNNKRNHRRLDEDFIADIIEKQYKPVKLFGKRYSDYSQFSAPVCRDQEFRIREEVQEGSELCSCCFNDNRKQKNSYIRSSDLSDMRSICDTRLYSSKRYRRHKNSRRYVDDYNNSALYDVIPVKEKSSPKSRRKFVEDNIMTYRCKEVPPSPRTHRPKLNLKVQNYAEYEESLVDVKRKSLKQSPTRENLKQSHNHYESELSELQEVQERQNVSSIQIKPQKSTQIQEEIVNASGPQLNQFINISNNDTTLNTQTTDLNIDKTDKALGEIKDILQNFLQEIKKESTHDEKSNITNKIEGKIKNVHEDSNKTYTNTVPNASNSVNPNIEQRSVPPFLPTFPNACCYPIIPMCPMNCLQNGYIIPHPSFTCISCAKNSKENTCTEKESCDKKSNSSEIKTNTETQELIKEIYKFVTQNPRSPRKVGENSYKNNSSLENNNLNMNKNFLTNRSVGGSNKAFKHDAMISTRNMKCYSKSCEAIGSRILSDVYHTNTSYSDTVLEKLSLEVTHSSTESDVSTHIPMKRGKRSRFKKVLKSLRLFRKKKDVIEELRDSESTAEVNKPNPPFKQHIMNYAVHGQEYFHPPPIPKPHFCQPYPHEYSYKSDHRNDQNIPQHPQCNKFNDYHRSYYDPTILTHRNPTRYFPPPICPNYDPHYNQLQHPQVPLCLKEIEVKSIGTQSERKMSIFGKFTKKIQPPVQQDATQQYNSSPLAQNKLSLWQSLQEKAKQQTTNPMSYSLQTQKQLTQGDMKLRNAMIKKLFHKRNPFSPRNLIVRTLLGKDKSSFGDPPKMYRPRMFL